MHAAAESHSVDIVLYVRVCMGVAAESLCLPPARLCTPDVSKYEHYCEQGVCCLITDQVACAYVSLFSF